MDKSKVLGYAAALAVVAIWSSWLVVSKAGAVSTLSIYDMAALRYGVSSIIALPVVIYFKPWREMTLLRIVVLTIVLGPVYILMVFGGFAYAPAAHGGIFMNGIVPAITLLLAWMWFKRRPFKSEFIGILGIIIGASLAAFDSSELQLSVSWRGDLLFIGGALFFSIYLVLSRLWNIGPTQLLLCSSLINAVTFVPVWYFFLPTGLSDIATNELYLQILYQGIIPNTIGLLLVSFAVGRIGSSATAAFMAAVPAGGAILSMLILAEFPGPAGWAGLTIITPAILLLAVIGNRRENNQ